MADRSFMQNLWLKHRLVWTGTGKYVAMLSRNSGAVIL